MRTRTPGTRCSRAAEELHLALLLHSLRHHAQAELAGHGDGGARDGGVLGGAGDSAHEGLVDLEHVDRELLEVGDRGVAGAEVVDGQAHAEGADRVELAQDLGIAAEHAALAELQLQQRGVDPALLQGLAHDLGEVAAHELAERDVDRDPAQRKALVEPGAGLGRRRAQHPAADRHHQPRFLGERDELRRGHVAELGRLPAQQRLRAADLRGRVLPPAAGSGARSRRWRGPGTAGG